MSKLFTRASVSGATLSGANLKSALTALWDALNSGGFSDASRTTITATATLVSTQCGLLLVDATSAAIVLTLPTSGSATDDLKYEVRRIDSSANSVTVVRGGTDTIEGAATALTIAPNSSAKLQMPGGSTNWRVLYLSGGSASAARAAIAASAQATRIDVASVAGTVNLTTAAPDTDDIRITGALAITAFTVAAGRVIRVTASGAHTLTNNANIVTNSGANIVCAAGDTYLLRATAANTVEVLGYTRAGAGFAIRAWCLFDGTVAGTNAPTAGGNVSSVTRNGAGDWTVNFSVALPDTLYAVAGSSYNAAAQLDAVSVHSGTGPTASAVRVQNVRSGVGAADSTRVSIIVVR